MTGSRREDDPRFESVLDRQVRTCVRELNRRIAEHLRYPSGPRIPVAPVDVDAAVSRWRDAGGLRPG